MQVKGTSRTPCAAAGAAHTKEAKQKPVDATHSATSQTVPDTIVRDMAKRSPDLSQLRASTAKASLEFLSKDVAGSAMGYMCPSK